MDAISIEKYQAMKKYNYCSNFISSLIQCSLLVVMLGLFLSSPLWLPALCSSMKLFFIQLLPKIVAVILAPKCLFLAFNLIVIFLVGESRLTSSCPHQDIYEEYVAHARRLKGVPSSEVKVNEGALVTALVEVKKKKEEEKEEEEEESEGLGEDEEEMGEDEEEEEEESEGLEENEEEMEEDEEEGEKDELSNEELNKRVEEFIARVNMQRRLEEKMLVCWEERIYDFRIKQ